jgi:hypothetical protein
MDSRFGVSLARRCTAALAALALAVPAVASAQDGGGARWELSAGPSMTLNSEWTGAAFAERIGEERTFGRFTWAPDLAFGWIAARSTHRANLDHDVGVAALGVRVYLWRRLFLSEQGAIIAGRTDALSSAGEFVSSLGWQGERWVAMVRHISNADLHKPNHGETMLLVGFAF